MVAHITILDPAGEVLTDRCSAAIAARAIRIGDIARTGTPLVFRMTHDDPAGPGLSPAQKRRRFLATQKGRSRR